MKKTNEGKETRELNLIANKGGSGSVGFKLSIPKPWATALGVDLNNRSIVASFDKIIISGIKKISPNCQNGSGAFLAFRGWGFTPLYPPLAHNYTPVSRFHLFTEIDKIPGFPL